jgi:hypothetical protein
MKFRGALFGGFLIAVSAAKPANAQHFFPSRPRHVALLHARGVLTDYGIGNHTGGFSIRDSSGRTTDLYLAYPTYIDGRVCDCVRPPKPGESFGADSCKQWPKNIVIGTTKVRVTYWWMFFPGTRERVRVSDTIDRAS